VILHRLAQAIRRQDWSMVVMEVVIVVLGVFIGIQVANWNEERLQQESASVYIERIREDLAANREDLSQRAAYFSKTREHGLAALQALDRPQDKLGEAFLIDIYQASQIVARVFGRDTYDEILAVGAIGALKNVSVRKRLANFYRGIGAPVFLIEQIVPYRELVRRKMPYAVQAEIRARCGDRSKVNDLGEPILSLPDTCVIQLTGLQTSDAVARILDADIRDELVRRLSDLDSKIAATGRIIERLDALDSYLSELEQ